RFWGEQQVNVIETGHSRDALLGVPVYSLYSETRKPTRTMLEGLECLVIDLQDVGTRIYTFAWTMMACLESCAEAGIPVVRRRARPSQSPRRQRHRRAAH